MKKLLQIFYISRHFLILGILLNGCSKDKEEQSYLLDDVSVFTLSSSIEENNLKSAKVEGLGDDFLWINGGLSLYLKVVGVEGVLERIWLMANDDNTIGEQGGELVLFENKEIKFDLSGLQKIIESEQKTITRLGNLNTVNIAVKYIDITVLFKGEKYVIRQIAQNEGVPGAKVWDLMLKDPVSSEFKWITFNSRQLVSQRPTNDENVVRINAHESDNGETNFWLGMDNLSNKDWIRKPPPWRKNADVSTNGGRYAIFYTLDETSVNKQLEFYLDICFSNAAIFCPFRAINDPANPNSPQSDIYSHVYYSVINDWTFEDIQDLEGNPYSSDEFTITDILPGMLYPNVIVNVTVDEK